MIKTIYAYFFCSLHSFFDFWSDDRINYWKAGLIIQCAEMLLAVTIVIQIQETLGLPIGPKTNPLYLFGPVSLALAVMNYNFYLKNDAWKKYRSQYLNLKPAKRRVYNLLVVLFLVGAVMSVVLSLYSVYLKYKIKT